MGGSFHLTCGWVPDSKDAGTLIPNKVTLFATLIQLFPLFFKYVDPGNTADNPYMAEVWLFTGSGLV